MDRSAPERLELEMRRDWAGRQAFVFVLLLTVASGAAVLVCEISWSRQIGLVIGQTTRSGAIVLGFFFLGMSTGQILGSVLVGRCSPLWGYGLSELAGGLAALAVPWGLSWLDRQVVGGEQTGIESMVRSMGCGFFLMPATVAYGATWPFLAAWASSIERKRGGWGVAMAYSANTVGAVVGTVVTSAVLLVRLGVVSSNLAAGGMSIVVGLVAVGLGWRGEGRVKGVEAGPTARFEGRSGWFVVAFGSGVGLLALQVLSGRLFALVFHNSTYTFGLVLTVFLGALAVGAAVVSRVGGRWTPEDVVAVGSLGGALLVGILVIAFTWATGLRYFRWGTSFGSYMGGAFGLVFLVLFAPVVMLGTVLPATWRVVSAGGGAEGRAGVIGWLTAVNGLGAGLGALAAELVLLPRLGLWKSLGVVVLVFGGTAVVAMLSGQRRIGRKWVVLVPLSAVLVAWLPEQMSRLPEGSAAEVVGRWEGSYGQVDLVRRPNGSKILRLNLHYGLGSTGAASPREFRQGHIPLLLHEEPRSVVFLGLGTGVTAASALRHRWVERIEVVELIPEVVEGARALGEENLGLMEDERVRVVVDDARHWARRTRERFDVVVCDLFVPWESRTGYLYTVDFYRQARARVATGGIFCQWLPLYQLGEEDFETIANSFAEVFPHTTMWWGRLSSRQAILALVGTEDRVRVRERSIAGRLPFLEGTLEEGEDRYLGAEGGLARLYLGDWRGAPGGVLNTDEHPRVEFLSPVHQADDRLLRDERFGRFFRRMVEQWDPISVDVDGRPMERGELREGRAWQGRRLEEG